MIKTYSVEIPMVGENTYCLVNDDMDALIVDPGGQADLLISWIKANEWHPKAVLLTHGHFDHIGALDAIRDYFHIEGYIHELEKDFVVNPSLNLSQGLLGQGIVQREIEHTWTEMGYKSLYGFNFETRHVPGHSPGSMIYIFHEDQFVISGDTVFAGSIGRTDFPGGSMKELLENITDKMMTIPDSFILYPGHGEQTTIAKEKNTNSYLKQN